MRVLTTGRSGFLLSNVLHLFDWEIIPYEYGNEYSNIDLILHFGSPTDYIDFENKVGMASGMIDITTKLVTEALANDCKLIFASSMGALYPEDDYSVYKKAMEQYIEALVPDHVIMRIPRVYGKNRKKGLMRRFHLGHINDSDWNNQIEYIDIHDFIGWFVEILSKNGIQFYNGNLRYNTIKELKEIYCKY